MTWLLILFTTACTIAGQLMLKHGIAGFAHLAATDRLAFLARVAASPWVAGALALQVAAYVAWFFVIAGERLGVAFALSGASFYALTALAAWWLFDERLSPAQWLGLLTITVGVALLAKGS